MILLLVFFFYLCKGPPVLTRAIYKNPPAASLRQTLRLYLDMFGVIRPLLPLIAPKYASSQSPYPRAISQTSPYTYYYIVYAHASKVLISGPFQALHRLYENVCINRDVERKEDIRIPIAKRGFTGTHPFPRADLFGWCST